MQFRTLRKSDDQGGDSDHRWFLIKHGHQAAIDAENYNRGIRAWLLHDHGGDSAIHLDESGIWFGEHMWDVEAWKARQRELWLAFNAVDGAAKGDRAAEVMDVKHAAARRLLERLTVDRSTDPVLHGSYEEHDLGLSHGHVYRPGKMHWENIPPGDVGHEQRGIFPDGKPFYKNRWVVTVQP